jgi:fucose 4-O-acetylase-like acetyltransferase
LSNKRHGWIDYDRGISIVLVTYRHTFENLERAASAQLNAHSWLEYINVFFFGFRMPLFFIASGMFIASSMEKAGYTRYVKNRMLNILYPMLLWGVIQISLQLLFSRYTSSSDKATWHSYYYLITNPRATGQFWYLNALFFVGIIYATLKFLLQFKIRHQLIFGCMLYAINGYLHAYAIESWLFADIFKYYLFFAIGDLIAQFMKSEKASRLFASLYLIVPLLVAFILIQLVFTSINLNADNNYQVENGMPLFFLLVALVGCALSISISFTLKKWDAFKFIRVVGYNSVHIYCMQILVIGVVRIMLMNVFGFNNVPLIFFLTLAAAVVLPMLFYNLMMRMGCWWLFTLKKPVAELESIQMNQLKK